MPLVLQPLSFAIICDGNELEAHQVKQDGQNSISAYVASEAGKVSVSQDTLGGHEKDQLSCISNSKSRLATTCSTSTSPLPCISMGSAYTGVIYELDTGVR